jgi:DNA-binding phage protein
MPLHLPTIKRLIGDRTITEVAHAAGMTDGNLHRLLRPDGDPKLSTLERLARALGVSVRELIR